MSRRGDDKRETPGDATRLTDGSGPGEGSALTDGSGTERSALADALDRPDVLDRPLSLAVGVVVVLAGLGAVAGLAVVPAFPTGVVATAVAIALVLGAAAVGTRRLTTTVEQADLPVVERRGDVVVPGTDFDDDLARAVHGGHNSRRKARTAVSERLQTVAASVLAATERVPLAAARERVAAGEWPPDAALETLLDDDEAGDVTTDRFRTAAGRATSVERRVDRVVRALAETMPGVDTDAWGSEDDRDPVTDTRVEDAGPTDRRTRRWTGVVGLAMLTVGVGVFVSLGDGTAALVVAAAAVVGAAGYAILGSPPAVSLAVERSVDTERPEPGERVGVTVTVENAGETWLTDLRVVDGVPAGLCVTGGSPRYATALRPGQSVTFSYGVEATRGGHAFDPVRVVARDPSGATERERAVDATGATAVECVPDLDAAADVPVFSQTARRTGRVRTDVGGEGVEFHSVREYRQGDPLSRVDWNRVATTGEFATLQFHEERAATVVVVVDARQPAYVTGDVDGQAVPERQLEAADRLVSSLLSSGDSVGLAAFSPEWCWLEPRGGDTQRARARRLLATHPAFDAARPDEAFYGTPALRRLRQELPGHAQLVVLSPLCDDRAAGLLREFHARGYPVTVVSPDATGDRSPGQRLAAVERAVRLSRLRRSGLRVVDWDPEDPLAAALEAADRRWSG